MATPMACPACGTPMREIVWGYGTIADVADAGDVVIGGCVVDVDTVGRVAALQCPACGARADQHGVELERPEPPATTVHPFDVAFSSPQPTRREVTMTEHTKPDEPESVPKADGSLYVEDDFGGVASGGDWRDHVEPYASREDQLPGDAARGWRDRIDPYASEPGAAPLSEAAPGEHIDARWRDTSDATDAEEEGWPSRD